MELKNCFATLYSVSCIAQIEVVQDAGSEEQFYVISHQMKIFLKSCMKNPKVNIIGGKEKLNESVSKLK